MDTSWLTTGFMLYIASAAGFYSLLMATARPETPFADFLPTGTRR